MGKHILCKTNIGHRGHPRLVRDDRKASVFYFFFPPSSSAAFRFSSRNLDWFGIPPLPFPPPSPLIALKFNFLPSPPPFSRSHEDEKSHHTKEQSPPPTHHHRRDARAEARAEAGAEAAEAGTGRPPVGRRGVELPPLFRRHSVGNFAGRLFFPTLSFGAPGKRKYKSMH